MIWALDDHYNWFTQDGRYNIGWYFIGIVGIMMMANVCSTIATVVAENMSKIREICRKFKGT